MACGDVGEKTACGDVGEKTACEEVAQFLRERGRCDSGGEKMARVLGFAFAHVAAGSGF
jgi:hypothetical protein